MKKRKDAADQTPASNWLVDIPSDHLKPDDPRYIAPGERREREKAFAQAFDARFFPKKSRAVSDRVRTNAADSSELADLRAAYALLNGVTDRDEKGLPAKTFLKEGSNEEILARQALSRLLRSKEPLDSLVRQLLADLFDPKPRRYEIKSALQPVTREVQPERQLRFVLIGRRAREDARRLRLAHEVLNLAREIRKKHPGAEVVTKAIVDVAATFKISAVDLLEADDAEFARRCALMRDTEGRAMLDELAGQLQRLGAHIADVADALGLTAARIRDAMVAHA